jgi:hypothetical protein
VFRKSWLLGICIVLALGAYAANELGFFKKKTDDPKDASAEIVKIANQYIDLNARYQQLQQDQQQRHDADKEAEISQLKQKIAEQQRDINGKAQSVGNVMVPDPTANGGVRLIPANAVEEWTACVHNSSQRVSASGSVSFGPFSFGGSSSTSSNSCNALLQ